MTSSRII